MDCRLQSAPDFLFRIPSRSGLALVAELTPPNSVPGHACSSVATSVEDMVAFGLLILLQCYFYTLPIFATSSSATTRRYTAHAEPPLTVPFSLRQEITLAESIQEPGENGVQTTFHVANVINAQTRTSTTLKARPTTVWRPRDPDALQHARLSSLRHAQSEPVEWEEVELIGPDIEDKHTLGQLARMTGNAYALPGEKSWYDIDDAWNTVRPSH